VRGTGQLSLYRRDRRLDFAELHAGEPHFRQVGVEHNVVNANEGEFVFIESEVIP